MMQHMVMKHGSQFDSYFEHITYPLTLYSGACSAALCSTAGKYLAYSPELAKVLDIPAASGSSPVYIFIKKERKQHYRNVSAALRVRYLLITDLVQDQDH